MDDKRFGLAIWVPGLWLGTILFFVAYTIASPVLFFWALFSPHSGIVDMVESFIGETIEGLF